jgi:hypothetical protein
VWEPEATHHKIPKSNMVSELGLRLTFDSVGSLDLLIGRELDDTLGKHGCFSCQEQGRAGTCTAAARSHKLSQLEQGLCGATARAHASVCCATAMGA